MSDGGVNSPTRERILKAAHKLFYEVGIRSVGVDAIAAKAGLTKRTLYYHFRSKDDLIAACLESRDQPNLAAYRQWFEATEGDAADKVEGIFRNLAVTAGRPKWKGCGFLRASVELIDVPGHPALRVGRAHKKRVEEWFRTVLGEAGVAGDTAELARQLVLLLDGAFAVVLLHRDPGYMESAGRAAAALVRDAGRR